AAQGARLPELQQHRLPRPRRPVRGHGDLRRAPGADPLGGVRDGAPPEVDGRRNDHAAHVRPAETQGRPDERRGSRPRDRALDKETAMAVTMHQLLKTLVDQSGPALHITTNSPPQIRIDGKMVPLQLPPMTAAETKQVIYSVLTDNQKHRLEETLE